MSGNQMNPSPVPTGAPDPTAPLQAPVFPPDILPIYIAKVEPDAGATLAEMAASMPARPAPVPVLANVDDPTSPPPRNDATPSPGAYQAQGGVVPPPAPQPTEL
jgi:hypothetical protein